MNIFRLLPHVVCFLLLAPAFGSPVLPLYDYPVWHDDFQGLATSPDAATWSARGTSFCRPREVPAWLRCVPGVLPAAKRIASGWVLAACEHLRHKCLWP